MMKNLIQQADEIQSKVKPTGSNLFVFLIGEDSAESDLVTGLVIRI